MCACFMCTCVQLNTHHTIRVWTRQVWVHRIRIHAPAHTYRMAINSTIVQMITIRWQERERMLAFAFLSICLSPFVLRAHKLEVFVCMRVSGIYGSWQRPHCFHKTYGIELLLLQIHANTTPVQPYSYADWSEQFVVCVRTRWALCVCICVYTYIHIAIAMMPTRKVNQSLRKIRRMRFTISIYKREYSV